MQNPGRSQTPAPVISVKDAPNTFERSVFPVVFTFKDVLAIFCCTALLALCAAGAMRFVSENKTVVYYGTLFFSSAAIIWFTHYYLKKRYGFGISAFFKERDKRAVLQKAGLGAFSQCCCSLCFSRYLF